MSIIDFYVFPSPSLCLLFLWENYEKKEEKKFVWSGLDLCVGKFGPHAKTDKTRRRRHGNPLIDVSAEHFMAHFQLEGLDGFRLIPFDSLSCVSIGVKSSWSGTDKFFSGRHSCVPCSKGWKCEYSVRQNINSSHVEAKMQTNSKRTRNEWFKMSFGVIRKVSSVRDGRKANRLSCDFVFGWPHRKYVFWVGNLLSGTLSTRKKANKV